jgi:hypothetical protein
MPTVNLCRLGSAYSVESTVFEHATRGLRSYEGLMLRAVCRDWRDRFVHRSPVDDKYRMYAKIAITKSEVRRESVLGLLGSCMEDDMVTATEELLRYIVRRGWRRYRLPSDPVFLYHSYTLLLAAFGKTEGDTCLLTVAHGALCGCRSYASLDGQTRGTPVSQCEFDRPSVVAAIAALGIFRRSRFWVEHPTFERSHALRCIRAAMMHGHPDTARKHIQSVNLTTESTGLYGGTLTETVGNWRSREHPELQSIAWASSVYQRQMTLRAGASSGDVAAMRDLVTNSHEVTHFDEHEMYVAALLSGSRPMLEFLVGFYWPKCTHPSGETTDTQEHFIYRVSNSVKECASAMCSPARTWFAFKHQRAPVCELMRAVSTITGRRLKVTLEIPVFAVLKHDIFRALCEESVSMYPSDLLEVRDAWDASQVAEIDQAIASGKWKVVE